MNQHICKSLPKGMRSLQLTFFKLFINAHFAHNWKPFPINESQSLTDSWTCSPGQTSHVENNHSSVQPLNFTPTVTLKRNFLGRLVKILGCEEINRPTVKSMESFSASEPSEFRTLVFFPRLGALGIAAKRLGWTEQETESVQSWSRGQSSHSLEVDGSFAKTKTAVVIDKKHWLYWCT